MTETAKEKTESIFGKVVDGKWGNRLWHWRHGPSWLRNFLLSFALVSLLIALNYGVCTFAVYNYCREIGIRFPFEGMPFISSFSALSAVVIWIAFQVILHSKSKLFNSIGFLQNLKSWMERAEKKSNAFRIFAAISIVVGIGSLALLYFFPYRGVLILCLACFCFVFFLSDPKPEESPIAMQPVVSAVLLTCLATACIFPIGYAGFYKGCSAVAFFVVPVVVWYWFPKLDFAIAAISASIYVAFLSISLLWFSTTTVRTFLEVTRYGGGCHVKISYEDAGGSEKPIEVRGYLLLRTSNAILVQEKGKVHWSEYPLEHVRKIYYGFNENGEERILEKLRIDTR